MTEKDPTIDILGRYMNNFLALINIQSVDSSAFRFEVELVFLNESKVRVELDFQKQTINPIEGSGFDFNGQRIPDSKQKFADVYNFSSKEHAQRFIDYAHSMRAFLEFDSLSKIKQCASLEMTCKPKVTGTTVTDSAYVCTLKSDCQ